MPESEEPKKITNNNLHNSQNAGGVVNADTVNVQRIGGDIWNIVLNIFFGRQKAADILAKNRRLLLAEVKKEVAARLKQSLHNAVLINLDKELQPQQVKRLWDAEVKIGLKPPEHIPKNTSILEVFDSVDVGGKLLILGKPGAGKTTTLLELAQSLIERAEEQPDYPIPVLFNLSSWKEDKQSITDWLIAELKSKYGVSTKFGKEWVENHQLLPLLDGLDELKSARQKSYVRKINEFLQGEYRPQQVVVSSRTEEYQNLLEPYGTHLQLNAAIDIQVLTDVQIQNYLIDINLDAIWPTINNDSKLLELVKTPLILSIFILSYQNIAVERWQKLASKSERLQYLLNVYWKKMLTRNIDIGKKVKQKFYDDKQTKLWLRFLAKMLKNESETEFLIERIQPKLLKNKQQLFLYFIGVKIIFGLVIGLSLGLYFGLIFQLFFGHFFWMGSGLSIGLILACKVGSNIKPLIPQNKNWSWLNAKKGFTKGIIFGLSVGLIIGVVNEVIFAIRASLSIAVLQEELIKETLLAMRRGFFYGLYFWSLILSLIFGITFGLIYGTIDTPVSIKRRQFPNQGIWYSGVNAVRIFLMAGLALGISFWLINKLTNGVIDKIINQQNSGLILGMIGGLNYLLVSTSNRGVASLACVQHFTLRLILYFNGYVPWNYARFLDYCTKRLLLQRIGGRYRFIHKLLQDHLTQMEFKRK